MTWTADFEPADSADPAELESMFSQIYRDGLESIRSRAQVQG